MSEWDKLKKRRSEFTRNQFSVDPDYVDLLFVAGNKLQAKPEAIKDDLVKWSRSHDPPEQEEQIHLWCSINRIIGDHFGTDWM